MSHRLIPDSPVEPSTVPDASPALFSRRGLSWRAAAGLAAAVGAAPLLAGSPAEAAEAAWGPKHAKVCQHRHRCEKHRTHTCRHKHRCKHRHHKRPTTQTPAPAPVPTRTPPPVPTTPPPSPPSGDPDFIASPLPTAWSLHLGNRFSYGVTPGLHQSMREAGSPEAWFERQLDPASIPDAETDAMQGWWVSIDADHTTIAQRDQDGIEGGWSAMGNYARWCLLRRISSQRQVLEMMTEFWENHLHVPVHDDGVYTYRAAYGKLLRSHALGRFDQMLVAAITHPAMGISLDNASSTERAPNENLGRELLELHTVGRGTFSEDDVKSSARILTGYRVDMWRTWNATYDQNSHYVGPVQVMGFTHANTNTDGRPVAEAYLTYLAHHPLTAARIARKLAVRFVSDQPSDQLVADLTQVYLESGTAIDPVLRALVTHPEFRAAAGRKVRTPTDDVVATYRALGAQVLPPTAGASAANAILYQADAIGQSPFSWGRPDGQPQDNRSWSSATRVLASFQFHYSAAGRWWPKQDIVYRAPVDWVPTPGMRFDALVDHLCKQLLGTPAPARLVQAACQATGTKAEAAITATHAIVGWKMPMLLTTLLDSPDHLHR
ncbi:MAG: hypothetical protein JWN68_397 [Nocardioides sp.]|uniref:DUF1800 domain-containing protein n=1 Tax=Nocardioides sp. TaxID=35761 RepID=UPI0026057D14|nr:DUF1800 domain-containing protein [Nocardioides sp.]MCW2832444.1 hypothetical protein [Nocardioides sp.]